MKPKLLLLGLSVLLGLYAAEVAFGIWSLFSVTDPVQRARMAAARRGGLPFDSRTKLRVILDLRRKERHAVPSKSARQRYHVRAGGREVLPLTGVSGALTVNCNETGTYLVYRSDEHGFHNPPGLHAGRPDLAGLGDSFTEGACVGSDENALARLREVFPRTVNLGVSGAGPLHMLAVLREYALPLHPRIVLWFHFAGNDLDDLAFEQQDPVLPRYLDPRFSQGLAALQGEIDRGLEASYERELAAPLNRWTGRNVGMDIGNPAAGWLRLRNLRGLLGSRIARAEPRFDRAALDRVLTAARDAVRADGGRLYFVNLPPANDFLPSPKLATFEPEVTATARGLGLPVVDLSPVFAAADPAALFPWGLPGHYNAAGYRLVAATVLRRLAEDGVAPR